MSQQETKQIQNYLLKQTLGTGTFGKVKLAVHKITDQLVAVKILEKERIETKSDLTRVQRELYILRKIRHPNIVQLYEILESATNIYLVMEYASGGELFEFIVQKQKLSEQKAAYYLLQLLDAVEYLHSQGVVHRDLKPENLLLDENQQIKVVDFGLSNIYKEGQKLKTACGSPCYAAPEMLHGRSYDGKQTDIWSCGIVLFAMICGYLPFEDQNTTILYEKIKYQEYEIPNHLSQAAINLLSGMLAKDPDRRFDFFQIKSHPFTKGVILQKQTIQKDLDPQILQEMSQLEQIDNTIDQLAQNKHNSITATYYLYQLKKSKLNKKKGQIISKFPDVFTLRQGRDQYIKRAIKMKTDVNTTFDDLESNAKHKINSTGGSSSKEQFVQRQRPEIQVKSLQSTLPRRKNNFFDKTNEYNELLKITNSVNVRGTSNPLKNIQRSSPDQIPKNVTTNALLKRATPGTHTQDQSFVRSNSTRGRSSLHQIQKITFQTFDANKNIQWKLSSLQRRQGKTLKSVNKTEPNETIINIKHKNTSSNSNAIDNKIRNKTVNLNNNSILVINDQKHQYRHYYQNSNNKIKFYNIDDKNNNDSACLDNNNSNSNSFNKQKSSFTKVVPPRHYLSKPSQIEQKSVPHEQQRNIVKHQKTYLDDSSFTQHIDQADNLNPKTNYMRSVGPQSPLNQSAIPQQVESFADKMALLQKANIPHKRRFQRTTDQPKNQQKYLIEQIYSRGNNFQKPQF